MKIFNLGIDIVDIDRIEEIISRRPQFVQRYFNSEEIEGGKNRKALSRHIAGRFAAKEAVAKSLGTGFSGFSLKDICIVNDKRGKPVVVLKGKAEEIAKQLGVVEVVVSISFSKNTAAASAVALCEDSAEAEKND